MASGFGLAGGPGRCFPFWQEVLACYVVNAEEDNPKSKSKCMPALEDYYECLHHKKERAKAKAMQAAYNRWQKDNPRENAPSVKDVKTLGLVDATPEEMNIKLPKYLPSVPRSLS